MKNSQVDFSSNYGFHTQGSFGDHGINNEYGIYKDRWKKLRKQ